MKKTVSIILLGCMFFSLCACGNISWRASKNPDERNAEIEKYIESSLCAIRDVDSGTEESNLRTATAVGKLLEMSTVIEACDATKFERVCRRWYEGNLTDRDARSRFVHNYSLVIERAEAYLENSGAVRDEFADCGVVFPDDISQESVQRTLNYMAVSMAIMVSQHD